MNARSLALAAAVALVVLSLAAPIRAADQAPHLSVLEERISLELKDADIKDFFRTFESLVTAPQPARTESWPIEVRLDSALSGSLSICLREVTIRTTLQAVCESLRCTVAWRWVPEPAHYVMTVSPETPAPSPGVAAAVPGTLDKPISLNLVDARLDNFLQTLSQLCGYDIVVNGPDLGRRTVTINVQAKKIREILDLVCRQASCRWQVQDGQKVIVDPQ